MPGGTLDSQGLAPSLRQTAVELCAASFVVLYQELALIRWLPGQVRVLAYFPNLILISAFLGLGVGCLTVRRRSLRWLWPASLLALVGAAWALSRVVFTQESGGDYLWLLYYDLPKAPVIHSVRLPILACFALSAVSFVPLGQLVAERLAIFRERASALAGYGWDLAGSLTGVVAFTLVSFLELYPVVWFALFLLAGLVFFRQPRALAVHLGLALGILLLVQAAEHASRYSPYYALTWARASDGVKISTNGSLHQIALPLARRHRNLSPYAARARECYEFPYRQLRRRPRTALVLGAGSGNDVAALLDQGLERIDAVEIDPVIVKLGRWHHPSRPYDSPRVRIHNTDARAFLNDTSASYDLIVFGTLDSQTRLSALSNVRLDNFVYTLEGIRTARARLSARGGMVMLFMVGEPYIHEKITGMLAEVFHELPVAVQGSCLLFNSIYLAGPAFAHLRRDSPAQRDDFFRRVLPRLELPTDDWPFLYLRQRGISGFYLSLMAMLLALGLVALLSVSPEMRRSLRSWRDIDLEMLLFGAAFLLLETSFVTSTNLVWGATWLAAAVVFGAILATVLLSTLLIHRRPLGWWWAVGGLVASVAVNYLVPVDLLVGRGLPVRLLLSVLFVGAPVFFASACFALRFRARERADLAFGWNLLGAVAGGLLEFLSMLVGFKALSLLALCLYLTVVLGKQLKERR